MFTLVRERDQDPLFPNVPVLFAVPVSFRFPYRMNKLLVVNPENPMFCQNFYETHGIWSVRGGGRSRRWRTGSVHLNILRLINSKTINIVTVRNISCGKVLCSHSSVILSMGSIGWGGVLSQGYVFRG